MSLFFKKKPSQPDDNKNNKAINKAIKNSVSLTCPHCGYDQTEPRIAVSTYCRGCGIHYKILAGNAVPNKPAPGDPFGALKQKHLASAEPTANMSDSQKQSATANATAPSVKTVKKDSAGSGFFQAKPTVRNVRCFECEREHQTPAEATSTLCPACGAYIALKNYDIRGNWNRRIQTRGDVMIHKKSEVTGITIRCHNLTAHGKLTGGVDCSGDFTLRSHGKIMGKVRCKRLMIEKRAHVKFSNPVHCEDAIIDGDVTGNFICTGKLQLKKKATLSGDIKVGTMVVEEGAKHHGRISIGT